MKQPEFITEAYCPKCKGKLRLIHPGMYWFCKQCNRIEVSE